MTKRINLISGPRNISTALMYAFANRHDTEVVDEPMYAYFLFLNGDDHPGRDEILNSLPTDLTQVKTDLFFQEMNKEIYFIKGMAKHYIEMDYEFLLRLNNVFLIRDPAQLIVSYMQVIPQPEMRDIGLKKEWELFQYLQEKGEKPIVMDSNDVLADPKRMLYALCDQLQIPFSDRMLSWESGAIVQDGVWAPYWYANVHRSTCFAQQNTSKPIVPESLSGLLKESYYYYHKLYDNALK